MILRKPSIRPRCGRALRPYEKPGMPSAGPSVCGLPEGHKRNCMSEQAYRRRLDRSIVVHSRYRQSSGADVITIG
jgi:hypothetical protein